MRDPLERKQLKKQLNYTFPESIFLENLSI